MNKRKLLTDREGYPGSITKYLVDILIRIKQESNDEFIKTMAHQAILKANHGNPMEDSIYEMASVKFVDAEMYIMKAKQAISDAEEVLKNG
jgi:hypothetical protein